LFLLYFYVTTFIQIINFYFSLIAGHNSSVLVFSTFFYLKLMASGFDGVRRWVNEADLLGKELLLIPIHMGGHWCLATIDLKLQKFCYYDSVLGDNRKCLQEIKSYMEQTLCSPTGLVYFVKMYLYSSMALTAEFLFVCMQDTCLNKPPFYSHNQISL